MEEANLLPLWGLVLRRCGAVLIIRRTAECEQVKWWQSLIMCLPLPCAPPRACIEAAPEAVAIDALDDLWAALDALHMVVQIVRCEGSVDSGCRLWPQKVVHYRGMLKKGV